MTLEKCISKRSVTQAFKPTAILSMLNDEKGLHVLLDNNIIKSLNYINFSHNWPLLQVFAWLRNARSYKNVWVGSQKGFVVHVNKTYIVVLKKQELFFMFISDVLCFSNRMGQGKTDGRSSHHQEHVSYSTIICAWHLSYLCNSYFYVAILIRYLWIYVLNFKENS